MKLLNRVWVNVATTGTGSVTPGSAVTGHCTFTEGDASNATVYPYLLKEGDDFEFGQGTYSTAGPSFSRDTVTKSKIGGTAGTSKMNLAGAATLMISPRAADLAIAGVDGLGAGVATFLATPTIANLHAAVSDADLALQGKHTFNLPAGSWDRGATGSPAFAIVELAAGTDYVTTLDFDGTTQEYAYATLRLPKSYNLGTISFVVQGMSSSATSTVARIGVQAAAVSTTEAMAVTYGTGQFVTLTNGGTANRLLTSSESSAITIANTPAAGDIIRLRLTRTPADAEDTMSEDFRIIEMNVFFTTNAGNDA